MSYFITKQKLTINKPATISDADAAHLLFSRRMKIGETVAIQDSEDARYECIITAAGKKELTITPIKKLTPPKESTLNLNLYIALVNEQSLDQIINEATQLGTTTITVFHSDYSPHTLNIEAWKKKLDRWNKISLEAAKQSNRLHPATIITAKNLETALTQRATADLEIISVISFKETKSWVQSKAKSINVWIGPEGGFSDAEIKTLTGLKNALPLHLGPRTLRSETAAVAAIALLQARFGDLH